MFTFTIQRFHLEVEGVYTVVDKRLYQIFAVMILYVPEYHKQIINHLTPFPDRVAFTLPVTLVSCENIFEQISNIQQILLIVLFWQIIYFIPLTCAINGIHRSNAYFGIRQRYQHYPLEWVSFHSVRLVDLQDRLCSPSGFTVLIICWGQLRLVFRRQLRRHISKQFNKPRQAEKRCSDEQKFEVFKIWNNKVLKSVQFRPNLNGQSTIGCRLSSYLIPRSQLIKQIYYIGNFWNCFGWHHPELQLLRN
ncbi:Hypothetical_protein [Hexamita inflata]|uniref:Hypothetical_protein n=1 Tax=Hexamita inflata TaxID=28002 RepID=A0AA86U7T9_9EUKA|nr:Hypothetical protein HINF_LOCUS29986 [Hexamita inflata]